MVLAKSVKKVNSYSDVEQTNKTLKTNTRIC